MKTINDLINGYYTHGRWHNDIKEFLNKTTGNYLEIGVFWGYFLAETAINFPHKKIYGIDPFISDGNLGSEYPLGNSMPGVREVCMTNINGLDNIILFECTTEEFSKNINYEILNSVTCVLVDGSHIYEDVCVDIDLIAKIKNDDEKLIVFDDLGLPGVDRAMEYFKFKFKDRIKQEISAEKFIIV